MAKKTTFQPEVAFTFLAAILGGVVTIISWGYGFGALDQPGPGLYPFFLGLLILCFSILLLLFGKKNREEVSLFGQKDGLKTFSLMSLIFIFWIIVMPYLGYVLVTLVATYCFCKTMKLEGWKKPLAISIGTALFIYVMFDYWLYIDLPRGILGP